MTRRRSWTDTPWTRALGVEVPIVLAPMAGGPSTPALVAAVSEAGGLGTLGAGYLQPDDITAAIGGVRARTGRPFGVNLFTGQPVEVDEALVAATWEALAPYREELGVAEAGPPSTFAPSFEDQVEAVAAGRVPFVSFTFAIPAPEVLEPLRRSGTALGMTVTNADEAQAAAEAGFDVLVAQGAEAGGHRGTFLGDPASDLVGLGALVPRCIDLTGLPVLASGGIMDGRAVAAALVLGAAGAQLGTAFLRCPEAGTSGPYRDALAASSGRTVITTVVSGRAARGLPNRITTDLAGWRVPPYPVMNALTAGLRRRAAELGRSDLLSLWAGQGVAALRPRPAAALFALLVEETEAALDGSPTA